MTIRDLTPVCNVGGLSVSLRPLLVLLAVTLMVCILKAVVFRLLGSFGGRLASLSGTRGHFVRLIAQPTDIGAFPAIATLRGVLGLASAPTDAFVQVVPPATVTVLCVVLWVLVGMMVFFSALSMASRGSVARICAIFLASYATCCVAWCLYATFWYGNVAATAVNLSITASSPW